MSQDKKECYNCKHSGCDPDGPYCGHPEAFALSCFGKSFNAMGKLALCTSQDRQLWESKNDYGRRQT